MYIKEVWRKSLWQSDSLWRSCMLDTFGLRFHRLTVLRPRDNPTKRYGNATNAYCREWAESRSEILPWSSLSYGFGPLCHCYEDGSSFCLTFVSSFLLLIVVLPVLLPSFHAKRRQRQFDASFWFWFFAVHYQSESDWSFANFPFRFRSCDKFWRTYWMMRKSVILNLRGTLTKIWIQTSRCSN